MNQPPKTRPVLAEPPKNIPAEQSVIGALMTWNHTWPKVADMLAASDFYRRDHNLIFEAMSALAADGRPFDAVTVSEELDRRGWLGDCGGLAYLASLAKNVPSDKVIVEHADIILEKAALRRLMAMGADCHSFAADPGARSAADVLADLQAQLDAVAQRTPAKRGKGYNLLSVDDLAALPPMRWKVKGLLPAEGTAAIYGPAGSGKSFLALDLAGAINSGREWFGRRVTRSPVVYVCLEGEGGLRNRVAAYRTAHGGDALDGVRFVLQPMSLLGADPAALVKAIKAAGLENPVVIIDTLNRAAPGADENSGADMSRIIDGTKLIQAETGGLAILVHHAGKDSTKGARGHSSLPAALDAVIAVRRDGENRKWSTRQAAGGKVKDGADDLEHDFTLQVHRLGEDEDGDSVTSCSIVPGCSPERSGQPPERAPLGSAGTKAVDMLKDLYEQHRSNLVESGGDPEEARVSFKNWCEIMRAMPRNRASEARTEAIRKGYVTTQNGYAHLVPIVPPGTWNGSTGMGGMVPFRSTPPLGGGTGTGTGTTQGKTGTDGPIDSESWLAGTDESGEWT